MKHAIIFPAYKPDDQLIKLLDSLKDNKEVVNLIVDNGNDYAYELYFEKIKKIQNCFVLKVNVNEGKGKGIKKGIKYLKALKIDLNYVIFSDADGQHTYQDISKFIEMCNNVDDNFFLIGDRQHNIRTPLKNRLGNLIYNFLLNQKYKLQLNDSLCGLRAINFSNLYILEELSTDEFDFEIDTLITIKTRFKINFKQVNISSTYFKERKTNFLSMLDSYKLIKYLYKKIK
jgi:hypothetical protein